MERPVVQRPMEMTQIVHYFGLQTKPKREVMGGQEAMVLPVVPGGMAPAYLI